MSSDILHTYTDGLTLIGSLPQDVEAWFTLHQARDTWSHTLKVAEEAVRIAKIYGENPAVLEQAALLHDIGTVVPAGEMPAMAEKLGIPLLACEPGSPRIVHQKLSRAMAERIFQISQDHILAAIECHTTLKPKATRIDKILFIADKLSFGPTENPRLPEIKSYVDAGQLDLGVLLYLDMIWGQRATLKLVHPWLIGAREELLARTNDAF